MTNRLKVGDLVRYIAYPDEHGMFVVVKSAPTDWWITMISMDDSKEYIELWTAMEVISESR
jgi:hypothetical protein